MDFEENTNFYRGDFVGKIAKTYIVDYRGKEFALFDKKTRLVMEFE